MNGFSTGTIPMSGVPQDADILAAYLYWETIDLPGSPISIRKPRRSSSEVNRVIDANHVRVVRAKSKPVIGAVMLRAAARR